MGVEIACSTPRPSSLLLSAGARPSCLNPISPLLCISIMSLKNCSGVVIVADLLFENLRDPVHRELHHGTPKWGHLRGVLDKCLSTSLQAVVGGVGTTLALLFGTDRIRSPAPTPQPRTPIWSTYACKSHSIVRLVRPRGRSLVTSRSVYAYACMHIRTRKTRGDPCTSCVVHG